MRWTPAFAVGLLGLVPWGLDPTPFDDPKAVRAHREGVLRRLKVPEEREAFLAWAGSER